MESKSDDRGKFPFYLKPGPDAELLKWVGEHLRKIRAKKTIALITKTAKVTPEEIERIESGIIHHNLGQFRQILRLGYGCNLEDVLAVCFEAFKNRFNPTGSRRFERDYHYSFCLPEKDGKHRTPILIGGNPENFLWAVPFRRLRNQPLCMDLLELAPSRKRKVRGTPEIAHDGVEIIHVINGSIQVHIEGESEGRYSRTLKHGESIHYKSNRAHQIVNDSNITSALLQIIRLPERVTTKP
jgi:mannose-6-phosphate isomerase-like protein (cupin superfamily)